LTPIHLAAERLRKKYMPEVSDKEQFDRYIDTVVRHVADIGKMVEEFAEFARMPSPIFTKQDMCELIQDAAFAQKCADSSIRFVLNLPDHPVFLHADAGQIRQVLTNLCKNAMEAI